MAVFVLILCAVCLSMTIAHPLEDLQRARNQAPRKTFRGDTFAKMSEVLSGHLRRSLGDHRIRDCDSFEMPDLLLLQADLLQRADPELLRIFEKSAPIRATGKPDGRRERHSSTADLEAYWTKLLASTPKSTLPVLRDGLCHDVVMRFAHHTSEATRTEIAANPTFVLPALPTRRHQHDGRAETMPAFEEYEAVSGCQACHSELVPPASPLVAVNCSKMLASKCGKRGQLMKDRCSTCTKEHSTDLSVCSPTELAEWCNHPDACMGADECPIWPVEFSAPFVLDVKFPSIKAAKSTFYYKYTSEVQVQTADYHEKCLPFVNARSAFNDLPCKLFFNPKGIYLSQPGRVQCCKFVAGVGAVPPEFLVSFKRVAQNAEVLDMAGNKVKCDKWEGPSGFKYWTVGHNDSVYKNFGHDILFQDGPTGATWRWGNFSVTPQSNSLFELPDAGAGHSCEDSCPKFLSEEELKSLHLDSHVVRAKLHALSGPDSDCTFASEAPPGQPGTGTTTIHDIDDSCCTQVQTAMKAHSKAPPQCIIGKNVSQTVSLGGATCTGEPCDMTALMPHTAAGMKFNHADWYGMETGCCTFLHDHKPPVPTGCPPKTYCMKIEGTYTGNKSSESLELPTLKLPGADVMVV